MNEETPEEKLPLDNAHADAGIVTALAIEMSPFISELERRRSYTGGKFKYIGGVLGESHRIVIAQKAIGFAKARSATQALIDAHTPEWVISAGFSGALQPHLQVGDIILANSLVDTHGHEMRVDLKMESDEKRRLFSGRCVTADEIVFKSAEKREFGEKYDALAVDLESLAVAQICKDTGTKFLAVRVISDTADEDLPPEIHSIIGETGSVRIGAALGSIWKRFGAVKDMWHLREKALTAANSLARFLNKLTPQLTSGSARGD